ncbi:MAG: ABC transporter ATP-binding protein [Gammaproteobacteria bacterium]|nr:ABC transporter ATP-binding protein [Gammaproteobacteria bacterium]
MVYGIRKPFHEHTVISRFSTLRSAISLNRQEVKDRGFNFKEFRSLIFRTWPYLRQELPHLIVWVTLRMVLEIVWISAVLITFDLFNNKILVGERLSPAQAAVLFVDESYQLSVEELIATSELRELIESEADEVYATADERRAVLEAQISKLDEAQRKTVRNRFLVIMAVAAVFFFMLAPIIDYYRTWILQRINQYLRITMIERAEHLSLRYHAHAQTGDAIYRVYQDSAMITNIVEKILLQPIVATFTASFSFIVLVSFSWVLGAMFLLGVVPILLIVAWFTPRLQIRSRYARESNSQLTSRIQEAFQAVRVVKANKALQVMESRFDADSHRALDAALLLRGEFVLMGTLVSLLIGTMLLAGEFLIATWVLEERATFLFGVVALVGFAVWNYGAFSAARDRIGEFLWNGNDLIRVWGMLQDMVVGLERAFFLLDLKPEIVDEGDAVAIPRPVDSLQIQSVAFAYDAKVPVLRDVNMTAEPGSVTAVIGRTGSGKSTLMSLLLRLYDVDAGSISINGVDLRHIKVDDLRANVAIALQQNNLFASSIAENIAYATPGLTREQIVAAADIACAHEFISELSDGYDTELGERGGKLSTGQRQRLSIARAVAKDTPILILDEPTASLDAETETRVLTNLREWAHDRIVFLITHRYSTIQMANQIALLEDGAIVACGSHDELMSDQESRYRAFFEGEIAVASGMGGSAI